MKTIDRHSFPPGGWQFRQPQSGWSAPNPTSNTFDQQVTEIIKHRLKNPAITAKHKLSTDREEVGNELENFNRMRLGIPLEPKAGFFRQRPQPPSGAVAAAAAGIKKAARGTAVILDWLGAGGTPVDQELAEARARTCVACQKNVPGAWYTVAPAELIKTAIKTWQSAKGSQFSFETKQGDNLKSCDVCLCLMRLKVFTPLEHIVSKTPLDIMKEFPSNCWIARRDQ